MAISILLAKIFGLTYVVVGLGLLVNGDYYYKLYKEYLKTPPIVYLTGILALVVGVVMVTYHNYWISSWEIIITIMGWMALLKGILLMILPNAMVDLTKKWLKLGDTLSQLRQVEKEVTSEYKNLQVQLNKNITVYGLKDIKKGEHQLIPKIKPGRRKAHSNKGLKEGLKEFVNCVNISEAQSEDPDALAKQMFDYINNKRVRTKTKVLIDHRQL